MRKGTSFLWKGGTVAEGPTGHSPCLMAYAVILMISVHSFDFGPYHGSGRECRGAILICS